MLIEKLFRFEASHRLPEHKGKCRNMHGHSWKLKVQLIGSVNPATQFVMDFYDLKTLVQPIVDRFDHQHLNWFIRYPSSENLATHVAHELYTELYVKQELGFVVSVSETEPTWATWSSYDHKDMARFEEGLDAAWRSPDPIELATSVCGMPADYKHTPVAQILEDSEMMQEDALKRFEAWGAIRTQMKLFAESAKPYPGVWEEIKQHEETYGAKDEKA